MKFFKQLFCKHEWPEIIHSTECIIIVDCLKCGKPKRIRMHQYKEIKRYEKSKKYGSIITGADQEIWSIVKIFECEKCGDIISREYLI